MRPIDKISSILDGEYIRDDIVASSRTANVRKSGSSFFDIIENLYDGVSKDTSSKKDSSSTTFPSFYFDDCLSEWSKQTDSRQKKSKSSVVRENSKSVGKTSKQPIDLDTFRAFLEQEKKRNKKGNKVKSKKLSSGISESLTRLCHKKKGNKTKKSKSFKSFLREACIDDIASLAYIGYQNLRQMS